MEKTRHNRTLKKNRITMPSLRFITVPDTDAQLDRALNEFKYSSRASAIFPLDYILRAHWLPGEPPLSLRAWYLLKKLSDQTKPSIGVKALVAERSPGSYAATLPADEALAAADASAENVFYRTAEERGLAVIDFCRGLRLEPITVLKPWGSEIWFSGMETRGTSQVSDGRYSVPLPWALSLAPKRLCAQETITLLKMLKPDQDQDLGNLYFELHQEKEEIYIVTRVGSEKQEQTSGAIRLGMNPQRIRDYPDAATFRTAFSKAVADYAAVRQQIDAWLDDRRLQEGIDPNESIAPQRLRELLNSLSPALQEIEKIKRNKMHDFTQLLELYEGDLVRVPRNLPHALQHGVEVLEFQSPIYERSIVSFEQKVLTQQHWDFEGAIPILSLEDGADHITPEKRLEKNRVVAGFDAVALYRIELSAFETFVVPTADYGLGFVVHGSLNAGLGGEFGQQRAVFSSGQAFLLPGPLIKSACLTLNVTGEARVLCFLALGQPRG